jgi:hypothetical protein
VYKRQVLTLYPATLQPIPAHIPYWIAYGNLLAGTDRAAALGAYAQACRLGHTGACYSAGYSAEILKDFQTAIYYYRLSGGKSGMDRAAQLESQIIKP